MKKLTYGFQVLILGGWIVVVLALFRFIADRQLAAVFAGSGFILLPLWVLYSEIVGSRNRFHIFVVLFFLLTSALPVFLLRVLNWGVEFGTLSIIGISAATLHRTSNFTYLAMLVSALILYRREKSFRK